MIPVNQIFAGIMFNVRGSSPIGVDSFYIRHVHVIDSIIVNNLGCPVSISGAIGFAKRKSLGNTHVLLSLIHI